DRLETEVTRFDDPRMDRPHRNLEDSFSFGPDPLVVPFDPGHSGRGREAFAQRPGIFRPVLKLDPGAWVGMPQRDHPHQTLYLPFKAPGRDEFSLYGREC